MIYNWKKQLFQGAIDIFNQSTHIGKTTKRKVDQLEAKVKERDALISEIVADNIRLKKKLNGEN
jgi:hypothetical protein